MITIAMSTVVGAARDRVWRALTLPDELVRWDERLVAPIDPVEGYPDAGRLMRWRYRLGSVRVVLEDHPLEIVPGEKLRTQLGFGHLRFDATWTLVDEVGESGRTRVALRLASSNSVPVVGGLLDRFGVREMASQLTDTRLRQIQKFCEAHP